ncbi:MAG: hypothetical protein ABIR79_22070 [Candidatus Binatia bacterium]
MRPRTISLLVCAVAVLVACVAHAADQPISGDQLKIKTDGVRSQIIFISKDPGFLFPGPADAPSSNGAVVEILPATVTGISCRRPLRLPTRIVVFDPATRIFLCGRLAQGRSHAAADRVATALCAGR